MSQESKINVGGDAILKGPRSGSLPTARHGRLSRMGRGWGGRYPIPEQNGRPTYVATNLV